MSGAGGVIIPKANAGDLMLRPDARRGLRRGRFHVWAVSTVQEALEIFTGVPAGDLGDDGVYPEGSLLGLAQPGPVSSGAVAHPPQATRGRRAAAAETD